MATSGKVNGVARKEVNKVRKERKSVGPCVQTSSDPLSILTSLIVLPLCVVALIVLHLAYYIILKVKASVRFQHHILLRHRQNEKACHVTRQPHGFWSFERGSDDQNDAQIYQLGQLAHGRWHSGNSTDEGSGLARLKLARHSGFIMPRHVALSLGPKPVRIEKMFGRFLLHLFGSALPMSKSELHSREQDQHSFALANLRAVVRYCVLAGIEQVSVYDVTGQLSTLFSQANGKMAMETIQVLQSEQKTERKAIQAHIRCFKPFTSSNDEEFGASVDCRSKKRQSDWENGESDVEVRRIRVNILDFYDGKDAMARVATILQRQFKGTMHRPPLTGETIADTLRAHAYPSEPDLLILHGGQRHVSTLHGFPLWLVKLCEVFHDVDAAPSLPLTSTSFLRSLEAFMRAEQRYGK